MNRNSALPLLVGLIVIILGGLTSWGAVLDEDYIVTSFTVEDGLPQNSVIGIAQTPDGYIWIATYNGLARFDGVQFTEFYGGNTPEIDGTGIFSMHLAGDGRLWLVSDQWRVSFVKDGHFQKVSGNFGLPMDPLTMTGEAPDGKFQLERVPSTHEIYGFDGRTFTGRKEHQVLNKSNYSTLKADSFGSLWGNDGTNWFLLHHADLLPYLPRSPIETGETNRTRIARPCRTGGFWVGTTKAVYLWRDGVIAKTLVPPSPLGSCTQMLEDAAGNLWIGTWIQGLWKIDPEGHFTNYPVTRGKLPEAVRALAQDSEGNLWVGTEGSGVLRVKKRLFHKYNVASGLSGEVIHSVASDSHDRVWVLSQAGLDRLEQGKVAHVADFELGRELWCDRQDRIWVGTYGGKLMCFANNQSYSVDGTNQIGPISTLLETHDGNILAGVSQGIWETDGTNFLKIPTPARIVGVKSLAEDSENRLYAGLSDNGLWVREGTNWSELAPGKFSDARSILVDKDVLWVGTEEAGLARVKNGRAFHVRTVAPDFPRQITCITRDQSGYFWLGSDHGIYRVSSGELDQISDSPTGESTLVRYTKSDGLPTVECASGHQPTVCQTRDGRLWFATVKGVAVVDPAKLVPNQIKPPVLIEQAQATGPLSRDERSGRKTYAHLGEPATIVVPPGDQLVEIHYTALTYTAPEQARFRYRLEGFSDQWTEAGGRRVAYFQGLPHGRYQFHVIACNNDGVWNETGAVLGMIVQPWFWQTAWFRVAVAAVCAGLIWFAFYLKQAQAATLNEVRLRIARDLHDEIGANLGSIGLNTELLMSDPALIPRHRQDLAEIGQVTSHTAQAVRDIVWFTNPEFDNTDGMLRRMRELATLMLAGRQWSFHFPEDAPSRPLSIEFRRNIFFIFKESLHNIVKHSKATEVRIDISLDAEGIKLLIADNGRGFDAAQKSSGAGLRNLRRRGEELGAVMTIDSKPGGGTSVRLSAPYQRPTAMWWQFRRNGDDETRG